MENARIWKFSSCVVDWAGLLLAGLQMRNMVYRIGWRMARRRAPSMLLQKLNCIGKTCNLQILTKVGLHILIAARKWCADDDRGYARSQDTAFAAG